MCFKPGNFFRTRNRNAFGSGALPRPGREVKPCLRHWPLLEMIRDLLCTPMQCRDINVQTNIKCIWIGYYTCLLPYCTSKIGMLNDYRIFDYRIKCSFSFSFVSHSILEILHKFVHFIRLKRRHACWR